MRTQALIAILLAGCSRENAFTIPGEAWDSGCALPPVLEAGPELVSLGTAGPGETAEAAFQIRNTGEATLGIAWIQPMAHGVGDDGAFAVELAAGPGAQPQSGSLSWALESEGTLDVRVRFQPVHDGAHWGGLVVATADSADPQTPADPHMARETARGRVLFTGQGAGLGGAEPEVFLLGGIYPTSYAVEPGGTVRLLWEAHDPTGRYSDAQRSYLRDQDGELHEVSTWRSDWTAPEGEPSREGFARTATFARTDADGESVEATTPVFIWPTGRLQAPLCP